MTIRHPDPDDKNFQVADNYIDYFQSVRVPSMGSLTIPDDEIHVWRVSLEVSNPVEHHLSQLLSADEQVRLVRFRSPSDRRRYTVRRGILRIVLSAYSGVPGDEICFAHSKNGKPKLKYLPDQVALYFNTSSSGDLALIAVSGQPPIGIDVEFMRQIDEIHDIAARFFSKQERDSLRKLPLDLRLSGFYRIWTSKEAIVKADGAGLSMPLNSFVVNSDSRHPPQLLHTTQAVKAPERLILYGLNPGKNYSGALAAARAGLVIHAWSLNLNQMV